MLKRTATVSCASAPETGALSLEHGEGAPTSIARRGRGRPPIYGNRALTMAEKQSRRRARLAAQVGQARAAVAETKAAYQGLVAQQLSELEAMDAEIGRARAEGVSEAVAALLGRQIGSIEAIRQLAAETKTAALRWLEAEDRVMASGGKLLQR